MSDNILEGHNTCFVKSIFAAKTSFIVVVYVVKVPWLIEIRKQLIYSRLRNELTMKIIYLIIMV